MHTTYGGASTLKRFRSEIRLTDRAPLLPSEEHAEATSTRIFPTHRPREFTGTSSYRFGDNQSSLGVKRGKPEELRANRNGISALRWMKSKPIAVAGLGAHVEFRVLGGPHRCDASWADVVQRESCLRQGGPIA